MILSLHSMNETVRIQIGIEAFKRLREPSISTDEITQIANDCDCERALLLRYVEDLQRESHDLIEIDASCDYTDHFS